MNEEELKNKAKMVIEFIFGRDLPMPSECVEKIIEDYITIEQAGFERGIKYEQKYGPSMVELKNKLSMCKDILLSLRRQPMYGIWEKIEDINEVLKKLE